MRTRITITAKTDLSDADIEALVERLRKLLEAEQLVEVVFSVTDDGERWAENSIGGEDGSTNDERDTGCVCGDQHRLAFDRRRPVDDVAGPARVRMRSRRSDLLGVAAIGQEPRDEFMTPTTSDPGESGWQPIETAPKDGTHVLLWCGPPAAGGYLIGAWLKPPGYVAHWCDGKPKLGPDPTHWMPLPSPPNTNGTLIVRAVNTYDDLHARTAGLEALLVDAQEEIAELKAKVAVRDEALRPFAEAHRRAKALGVPDSDDISFPVPDLARAAELVPPNT